MVVEIHVATLHTMVFARLLGHYVQYFHMLLTIISLYGSYKDRFHCLCME